METKEIFDAAPLSVSQFLSETGQGLYIPPYQRAYSWELPKIRRLLSDVAHGLDQLAEFEDSICFLGTVIALRDINYTTVEPKYRSQVPSKVMTIIDGQQAMTTLLLLTTVLHEEIRVRAEKLTRDDEPSVWCYNQALDVTGRLSNCFEEDMRYGEHRYYPRLIRSYYDVWSRNKGEARYRSPIGYYLESYGAYARDPDAVKPYRHVPIDPDKTDGVDLEAYRHLDRMRDQMRSMLRKAVGAGVKREDDIQLPTGTDIGQSQNLQFALFNSEFPPSVVEQLEDDAKMTPLTRLIVFANYLLHRVTVAVVTAKREDYGFDMFEALNTTGQPLTAIETFKPRAIKEEGLDEWQESESKLHFDVVEAYLDREGSSSADKRQTVTSSVLLPFAMFQDGTKLTKRLNDQRRYLRTVFDKDPDIVARRKVLAGLAQVARFYEGPWGSPTKVPSCDDATLRTQAGIALAALREGGHDIVVGLLTRYFAAHRLSSPETVESSARQFLLAARSCAAFYALWRGSFGSTAGIDGVYRSLMTHVVEEGMPRFARFERDLTEVPPVEALQSYLKEQLRSEGIYDKQQWVARAAMTPVYQHSKPLTRLLLLAASQNSTPDSATPGLVVRGKSGLLETLELERWNDEAFATIEHVAPQAPSSNGSWNADLYEDPELINRIGNLTLLPAVENASASNRAWHLKRLMFRALSAATVEEAEKTLADAEAQGLRLGSGAGEIVRQARYLPLVAALAQREEEWTAEFVEARSQRLCSLAWDALTPWLGFEP
uniref:SspE protein n=1 Tax=Streptomyces yokosukanensis TaxID=67386 RepID=UPI002096616C|nr:Chain A, SspE protein [Streptomyces yokosukanensis]7DRR_B Chain B, SspE protein [Streptomyces yokosukanensis]7DRR_C Chain C, SspE protein [Streptomyces yokosukanensis]7DRR_D Chain D, SspE protein [Streptomyces yokosukanensis]